MRTARERTRLATLVLLLLLAGVAALAIWRAQRDKETDRALDRRAAVVAALDEARAETYLLAAQIAAAIFSEGPTPAQDLNPATISVVKGNMQAARADLAAMGETDRVAALDEVDTEMNQLMQDADVGAILASANSDAKMELGRQYYSRIWPGVEKVSDELQQLASGERSKLAAEQATASGVSDHTFGLLIGLSLLAFLGGASMLLRLVPLVVRPLAVRDLNKMASHGSGWSRR